MKAPTKIADIEQVAVAIIGGGPAGASTALALAKKGVAVTMLERDENDQENQTQDQSVEPNGWKIGEGLPPLARPLLSQLGAWERFIADGHLPSYGNSAAWGTPQLLDHSFIFDPHGHGWHLDRRRFDRMLRCAAIDAGARLRAGVSIAEYQRETEGWRLKLTLATGEQQCLNANFIVDASGRASWFARQQGAQRFNLDRLVGLAALLTPSEVSTKEPDQNSLTMVEAVEDGWWYAALLADGRLVAAYLSDGDLATTKAARTREEWLQLIERTTHLSHRLASHNYSIRLGPRIASANSSRLDRTAGPNWVAVGDAAMAYDPLSSQGILAAIETGLQAAAAIESSLCGDQSALAHYEQSLKNRWATYCRSLQFFYAQERRWPNSTFWQRRASLE